MANCRRLEQQGQIIEAMPVAWTCGNNVNSTRSSKLQVALDSLKKLCNLVGLSIMLF